MAGKEYEKWFGHIKKKVGGVNNQRKQWQNNRKIRGFQLQESEEKCYRSESWLSNFQDLNTEYKSATQCIQNADFW